MNKFLSRNILIYRERNLLEYLELRVERIEIMLYGYGHNNIPITNHPHPRSTIKQSPSPINHQTVVIPTTSPPQQRQTNLGDYQNFRLHTQRAIRLQNTHR